MNFCSGMTIMLDSNELERYSELHNQIKLAKRIKKSTVDVFNQIAPDGVLIKCTQQSKHDFILSPRELVDWILRDELLVCCTFPMGIEVVDENI
jgi:hypothetical protein